jgi:hypothetical protein
MRGAAVVHEGRRESAVLLSAHPCGQLRHTSTKSPPGHPLTRTTPGNMPWEMIEPFGRLGISLTRYLRRPIPDRAGRGQAGRCRRGGSHGADRPDRSDPRCPDGWRSRPSGRSLRAVEGSDLLSGDLIDGTLPDLPRHAQRLRHLPPLPGRAGLGHQCRNQGPAAAGQGDALPDAG